MQTGGQVEDHAHRVEEAGEHEDKGGANAADGQHEGQQGQEQAMAMHQQLHTLSNWEVILQSNA